MAPAVHVLVGPPVACDVAEHWTEVSSNPSTGLSVTTHVLPPARGKSSDCPLVSVKPLGSKERLPLKRNAGFSSSGAPFTRFSMVIVPAVGGGVTYRA